MKLFLRDRRKKKGEREKKRDIIPPLDDQRAREREKERRGKEGRKKRTRETKVRAENLRRRREGRAKDKEEWKGSRKKERVTRGPWGRGRG